MKEMSFSEKYTSLDEAIRDNFYIPTIGIMEEPEEPILEISGSEAVSSIKQKMSLIMEYKTKKLEADENNKKYQKQLEQLRNMFWSDCFAETNINILPGKIKEAIIDMIIEKAKELNYMGNYIELRKLFTIFSKEMIQSFSKIGSDDTKNEEIVLTSDMSIAEEEED